MTWDFAAQLARHGPDGYRPAVTRPVAHQYVRQLATTHYENFSVASLLLPRHLVRHFHAVYAYCRWSDDLADEAGGGERALALLSWWRGQLAECYAGRARHPVFVALLETIERFGIPKKPLADLLTAFEQDQRVAEYESFADLLGYCENSANPVGRLVLYLFECHGERQAVLSDRICTGLQLANFWQDVARDLTLGRVYLPVQSRRRFGVADDDLRAKRFTPAFAALMREEVDRARSLLYGGYPLIDLVSADARPNIELFLEGGVAILRKIEEAGFDVLTRRPVLSKWDKGSLVLSAAWRRLRAALG